MFGVAVSEIDFDVYESATIRKWSEELVALTVAPSRALEPGGDASSSLDIIRERRLEVAGRLADAICSGLLRLNADWEVDEYFGLVIHPDSRCLPAAEAALAYPGQITTAVTNRCRRYPFPRRRMAISSSRLTPKALQRVDGHHRPTAGETS